MVATGVEGVTQSTQFTLTILQNCLQKAITAPTVADQTYLVYDPLVTFSVPTFTNEDETFCPLTYSLTHTATGEPSFLTTRVNQRDVDCFTESNVDSGLYSVTVSATNPDGVSAEVTYSLTVEVNCAFMVVSFPPVLD